MLTRDGFELSPVVSEQMSSPLFDGFELSPVVSGADAVIFVNYCNDIQNKIFFNTRRCIPTHNTNRDLILPSNVS